MLGAPRTWTTTSVALPGEIIESVFDPKRNTLYLAGLLQPWIAVLHLSTMTYDPPIALPTWARSIDLTEGGDSLVYALDHDRTNLYFHDIPSGSTKVLTTDLQPGSFDYGFDQVRALANGRILASLTSYTALAAGSPLGAYGALIEYDLRKRESRFVPPANEVNFFSQHTFVARSHDRLEALISSGTPYGGALSTVYHSATGTVDRMTNPYAYVWTGLSHGGGGFWTVGDVVLNDHAKPVLSIVAGARARSVSALSPDGAYVYSAFDYGILKTRVSDGHTIEWATPPGFQVSRIQTSPDGRRLFAVSWDKVYAIDLP